MMDRTHDAISKNDIIYDEEEKTINDEEYETRPLQKVEGQISVEVT